MTDMLRLDSTVTRRVTSVDVVRNTLRVAILRGDLPGGSRLVQGEIAAQLDVSKTPVREAMRELAIEGLITLDSHRIGTVRQPDWAEMAEMVEMRRHLERMAVTLAMRSITEAELDQARLLAADLSKEADVGTWVQKNAAFHSIFHKATRTKRLSAVLQGLEEAICVFSAHAQRLHPEIRKRAIADHFDLLDAYRAHDVDRAVAIQLEHVPLPLANAASNLSASMDDSPPQLKSS